MNGKLIGLDKRYKGYEQWQYVVSCTGIHNSDNVKTFNLWREWCWQTWGASKELEDYSTRDLFDGEFASNNHWCWRSSSHPKDRKIYLKTGNEASAFSLVWLI